MEFLGNVFTNFIFLKRLLHEALVTGRVTTTSNNQTQLSVAIKEKKYCSSGTGSFDIFRSKVFAKVIYFMFKIIFTK